MPCVLGSGFMMAGNCAGVSSYVPSRCSHRPIEAPCCQVFFAAVGANGSLAAVMGTAPALFAWCFVQIAVHLAIILGVGRLLRFSLRDLLLASNANVRSRMAAPVSANLIDGLIAY